ncbi:MAG: DUF1565 domain-containing protein [Gammaproteobacteria bacterium]
MKLFIRFARKGFFLAWLAGWMGGWVIACQLPALAAGAADLSAAQPNPYHYYVAPHGSDANAGTAAQPFRTILRASRNALPGTTIHVAPGEYEGGFKTTMSGTAAQRISYVSTNKWGARLVPPMLSDSATAWDNRGNYVDIAGFEIDGSAPQRGVKWTQGIYVGGSFNVVRDNRIHHLGRNAPCAKSGGAGIGVDSYYKGIRNDVLSNTVSDIGPPGCRSMQGIYISTSGSVQNNVVYAVGGAAIQMWHDANNVVVSHNTVSGSTTGILVGGGDYYHTRGPNDFTAVHNNIVFDNRYGISEQGDTGPHNSYRNNLVYQNATADWQLRNGLSHSGTVALAPQFVRYGKRGNPDFRLLPSSPAIARGTAQFATRTDIAGRARPSGKPADIGAYQYR